MDQAHQRGCPPAYHLSSDLVEIYLIIGQLAFANVRKCYSRRAFRRYRLAAARMTASVSCCGAESSANEQKILQATELRLS